MSIQSESRIYRDLELMEEENSAFRLLAPVVELAPDTRSRLVFLTDPTGLAVERYKLLRRKLCALKQKGGLLLVTSPSSSDGKTLNSINVAMSLAEDGRQTCLVDLDLRAPRMAVELGYEPPEDGLVEVLEGLTTVSQSMRKVSGRPIYVLGNRSGIQSPSRHLSADVLEPFLADLRSKFEWVIVDTAPAIPMSDVADVLPHVDGALMVVRAGKTKRSLIDTSLEILGTKIWGVVLNDSLINGSTYYGYYGYGTTRKDRK